MEPRSPVRAYSALNRWATPPALLLGPQLSLYCPPMNVSTLNSPPKPVDISTANLLTGEEHHTLLIFSSRFTSSLQHGQSCVRQLLCAPQNAAGSVDPRSAENRIVRHKREQVNPIKRGACFCSAQGEIKAGERLSAVSVSLN